MRNPFGLSQLLKLPDNYTIEFDIVPTKGEDGEGMKGYVFRMLQTINLNSIDGGSIPGKAGFMFYTAYYGTSSYRAYTNGNGEGESLDISGQKDGEMYKQFKDHKYHIAILGSEIAAQALYGRKEIILTCLRRFLMPAQKWTG